MVDWQALRTPLGLPGQSQALCTRTCLVAVGEKLAPKPDEVRFYATSAPASRFSPADLNDAARDHWKIENSLHHVKDRTWLEDRHWVKNRRTATMVTMLRSVACGLVRGGRGGAMRRRPHCPARIEYFNQYPRRALKLITQTLRL